MRDWTRRGPGRIEEERTHLVDIQEVELTELRGYGMQNRKDKDVEAFGYMEVHN